MKVKGKKYPFAVRMVEDGTLAAAFDYVSFNHDTFVKSAIFRMVNGDETMRMKWDNSSSPSILDYVLE